MAYSGSDEEQDINVAVKLEDSRYEVVIGNLCSVEKLKEEISREVNLPVEQLCIIFGGKILNDNESIKSVGVLEGSLVHVVTKMTVKSQEQIEEACAVSNLNMTSSEVNATPFGLSDVGGLSGLSNFGMGTSNFMDLQQKMQSQLFNNPELLQQIVDNPFVQSLMSNPDYMKQLIFSNAQMQELIIKNPEIVRMLNNSELLKQTMEVVKNPAMLQVLLKSQDKILNNMENSEETKVKTDDLKSENSNTAEQEPKQVFSSTSNQMKNKPLEHGLLNNPSMQSLMQQIVMNPQLMNNMFNAPYVQAMLNFLSSNPKMAEKFITTHPVFSENPTLQEKMRIAMPNCLEQLQNPDVHNLLTNPEAMQAIMQIQQGMDQLHNIAPNVFNEFPGQIPKTESSASRIATPSTYQDSFKQFLTSMVTAMAQNEENNPQPEIKFSGELEQLCAMGFFNKDANIEALMATSGDVNAAVEQLLHSEQ